MTCFITIQKCTNYIPVSIQNTLTSISVAFLVLTHALLVLPIVVSGIVAQVVLPMLGLWNTLAGQIWQGIDQAAHI